MKPGRLIATRFDEWRRDEMGRAIEFLKRSKELAAREALQILRRINLDLSLT